MRRWEREGGRRRDEKRRREAGRLGGRGALPSIIIASPHQLIPYLIISCAEAKRATVQSTARASSMQRLVDVVDIRVGSCTTLESRDSSSIFHCPMLPIDVTQCSVTLLSSLFPRSRSLSHYPVPVPVHLLLLTCLLATPSITLSIHDDLVHQSAPVAAACSCRDYRLSSNIRVQTFTTSDLRISKFRKAEDLAKSMDIRKSST